MSNKRVFSDYDGTWDEHPEIWGQVDAIVTGRSWEEYDDLRGEWVGPQKAIFMNPIDTKENTQITIINHKANIINKCNVRKFFEDQQMEVDMLKILCPNCEIIKVESEKTVI